ncbi:MAG TPA: hypothetical protein VHN14_01600, partial [Kofleriaceae bacterium]|nr:hypothetical protein [Kofleriaceae bacterium]
WIRTEGVTSGLGANLTIEIPGMGWEHTSGQWRTTDWTFVTVGIIAGPATSFEVQARLGHYSAISAGHAWFDDLRLEAVP